MSPPGPEFLRWPSFGKHRVHRLEIQRSKALPKVLEVRQRAFFEHEFAAKDSAGEINRLIAFLDALRELAVTKGRNSAPKALGTARNRGLSVKGKNEKQETKRLEQYWQLPLAQLLLRT